MSQSITQPIGTLVNNTDIRLGGVVVVSFSNNHENQNVFAKQRAIPTILAFHHFLGSFKVPVWLGDHSWMTYCVSFIVLNSLFDFKDSSSIPRCYGKKHFNNSRILKVKPTTTKSLRIQNERISWWRSYRRNSFISTEKRKKKEAIWQEEPQPLHLP